MKNLFVTLCLLFACMAIHAANGVKVEILSHTSGLIRVERPQHYVLLPVEESAPESDVRILLNGKTERTVQIRLALNRTDYFVPMDISQWKDKNVSLYVITKAERSNVRNAADAAWVKEARTADNFDETNTEPKYRPAFHHTPTYGWMNDPNGMFYKDGVWHLCYQWNPYGSMWGNMTWGHSISRDLIHWEHMPAVVWSDGLGTIFSGSAAIDHQGTAGFGKNAVVGLYTSAAENQIQSLVYSQDSGNTFKQFDGNPVITADKECRDPNFFFNEQTQEWNLYLVNALEHEVWFYTSKDMKHWNKVSAFGHGYGCKDGVWECPDLMRLPVRGTNEYKWVLIVNINPGGPFGGSATQYFVGQWDGKTFTCESKPNVTKWMDYGKDHYATVSWANAPEGRNVVIAWMSNWQYAPIVPTKQFRSANSLPRDIELYVAEDGETYIATVPSPEVASLRGNKVTNASFNAGTKKVVKSLPANGLCEIQLNIDSKSAQQVQINLVNSKNERVAMVYNLQKKTFAMDRTESGLTKFSTDFPATTVAPISGSDHQSLRLFIDRASIEAFDGDGHWVMTNLVFPTEPYTQIEVITTEGKAKAQLSVWEIKC